VVHGFEILFAKTATSCPGYLKLPDFPQTNNSHKGELVKSASKGFVKAKFSYEELLRNGSLVLSIN